MKTLQRSMSAWSIVAPGQDDYDSSESDEKTIGTVLDEFVTYWGENIFNCCAAEAYKTKTQGKGYGPLRSCDSSITSIGTMQQLQHNNSDPRRQVQVVFDKQLLKSMLVEQEQAEASS